MNRSESIKELATALAAAQGELENPTKNARNPFFGSRYADLAEVLNAVRPALAAHGLAYMQLPAFADGVVSVETVLTHSSGEWISFVTSAPVAAKWDREGVLLPTDPQGVGSAITYVRRYALSAVCGVAQEDDDAEAATRPAGENGAISAKPDAPKVDFLDTPAPGKDNKGPDGKQKTWRQVVADNPSFVRWALDKMERLSTDEKLALRDALTPPPTPEPTPAQLALELTEVLENARVLGFLTDEQDARCQVALDSMDEGDLRRTLDWLATRMEAHKLQPVRQPVGVGSSSDLFDQ